ncbi:hypothetical protein OIV83_001519 [Microbotryomycetes sp. JL201]|nr:hypothetical protein OIV83_001519 [Microbotryomycetes sp. JL201]
MLGRSSASNQQRDTTALDNSSSDDADVPSGDSSSASESDWTDDNEFGGLAVTGPLAGLEATKVAFEHVNQKSKALFVDALGQGLAEEMMKTVATMETRTQESVDRLQQSREAVVSELIASAQEFKDLATRVEALQAQLLTSRAATALDIDAAREETVQELDSLQADFDLCAGSVRKSLPNSSKRR